MLRLLLLFPRLLPRPLLFTARDISVAVERIALGRGPAAGRKDTSVYVYYCYYYRGSYVVILRTSDELQTACTFCFYSLLHALRFCQCMLMLRVLRH